jgi:hypothetical protein
LNQTKSGKLLRIINEKGAVLLPTFLKCFLASTCPLRAMIAKILKFSIYSRRCSSKSILSNPAYLMVALPFAELFLDFINSLFLQEKNMGSNFVLLSLIQVQ